MYTRAIQASETTIAKSIRIAKFWQQCSHTELNERQRKVIQKMLESEPLGFEGGINNRKYVSITGARPLTATRDLDDLRQKGILVRNPGGGRSASYSLKLD